MNLFEIRAELENMRGEVDALLAASEFDESGEMSDQAIAPVLEALDRAFAAAADKAEAYARVIERLEQEAESWSRDAAACMARSRQAKTRVEQLKRALGSFVLAEGGKLKTPAFTLSAKTVDRHKVLISGELPDRFTKKIPNEAALKRALMEGDPEAAQVATLVSTPDVQLIRRQAGTKPQSEEAA